MKMISFVIGFWKTNQIVTLGVFHFIGPANSYTHMLSIHSAINIQPQQIWWTDNTTNGTSSSAILSVM